MTSNHQLKNDCKSILDRIRTKLPPEESRNVEPLLRQILDVTKALVTNAKVSPTEHEAALHKLQDVQREFALQQKEVSRLRKDLELAMQHKDKAGELRNRFDAFIDSTAERVTESAILALLNLVTHIDCVGVESLVSVVDRHVAESERKHPYYRKSVLALVVSLKLMSLDDDAITLKRELCDEILDT